MTSEKLVKKQPVVVLVGHIDHGKCVVPGTSVLLTNGEILGIEEIWKRHSHLSNKEPVEEKGRKGWRISPKGLNVYSFNGERVVSRPVNYIWKLEPPPQLIKIVLNSGDEVTVTPEHPFFVLTPKGRIEQKRADSLKKEEFVIVPQKLKFFTSSTAVKKRIVQRLEEMSDFLVFLDREKGKGLFQKLQEMKRRKLYGKGLFSSSSCRALGKAWFHSRDFVKVGRHLGFSYRALYEMIDFVKNSSEGRGTEKRSPKMRLPRIPEDLEKLGYILGCLVGDGQPKYGVLHSSNPEIQQVFGKYVTEVFGVSTYVKKRETGEMVKNRGWKTMARFLIDIADFSERKKVGSIKFPKVFLDRSFIQGFVGGWFDADGCVHPDNHSLKGESESKELIREIAFLLLYFGIHAKVYKIEKGVAGSRRKRVYYTLRVANNPYLKRFLKSFPIKHREKKKRIQEAISKSSVSQIFDLTPISGERLYSFYINEHLIPYFTQRRKYKFLSRYFLHRLLRWRDKVSLPQVFLEPGVRSLINPGEISCVKIEKVHLVKNRYKFVYDLTVPDFHNFIAERVFVHNTAILDCIRKTHVAEKEAGGISQHIGAYEIREKGEKITFIDTPGHEAFSAMRARGAKVADIAILVVAADAGVQAQTKEAIEHIKKAEIPVIVAINKVDKETAQPEKVKKQLAEIGIEVESLGGEIPSVNTSALTGEAIEELLELILLVAEMEKLKADLEKPSSGVIIESYLDSKRGPTATLLLREGTLRIGNIIGTSFAFGKIKRMEDFQGKQISKADPGQPVVVLGFSKVPGIGERFRTFESLEKAQDQAKKKEERPVVPPSKEEGKELLDLILKTDVKGSIEPIRKVLNDLPKEEVRLRILKTGIGNVTLKDVEFAKASGAQIIGFRVRASRAVSKLAEQRDVRISCFELIYGLVEGVRKLMESLLKPEVVRVDLGKLKTLVIFKTEKKRQIVGAKVLKGEIRKGNKIEVLREEERIGKGKVINLQMQKKDIEKGVKGDEVGILYEGNVKIKKGDALLIYRKEKKKVEI